MTARDDIPDSLKEAVEGLAKEARRQLEAHPLEHLLEGRRENLEVRLSLPLSGREEDLQRAARQAGNAVSEGLKALVRHRAIFRPGSVFCLRCASAQCEHSRPGEPRRVFTGYGATGLPRFVDFGQWLLERKDPRVSALYEASPPLVTCCSTGRELSAPLLPAYRDRADGFRLHGQVTAGWYRLKDQAGDPHNLAFTFQLLSTRGRRGPRRFGLNVVGAGPHGEPVEDLFDRLGAPPWTEALRWAREALETVEASPGGLGREGAGTGGGERGPGQRRASAKGPRAKGRRSPSRGGRLEQRLEGILGGLARRLEKSRRARERRTHHAQMRHDSGGRPTDMALADLRRAAPEEILFDVRRETLVVLGDRGRTHFFNRMGKHVTSVRYTPPSIERRRSKGSWRPATLDERAHLADLSPPTPGGA